MRAPLLVKWNDDDIDRLLRISNSTGDVSVEGPGQPRRPPVLPARVLRIDVAGVAAVFHCHDGVGRGGCDEMS